ncbi:hypothetical protein CO654_33580 [Rhizobium sp. L18]|nr:hypothetical protein CO654_33580 [Rhizobium sp. L18]
MVYEWDTRKARRAYILKILAASIAAIVVASFPALLLVIAMAAADPMNGAAGEISCQALPHRVTDLLQADHHVCCGCARSS